MKTWQACGPGRLRRVLPSVLQSAALALVAIVVALPNIAQAQADNLNSAFQSKLDSLREQYKFPGATAAYILPDNKIGTAATGLADVELKKPMLPQSRMLAASIGKSFVAATALALVHEGKLNLDAPISRWLGDRPWFSRLPNHDSITLRELLTHSAGLPDHIHMENFAKAYKKAWRNPNDPFSHEELVGFILDQKPLFKAGDGWSYTDTGYILVGLIIEKVTGHKFYDEAMRRFIVPLHLTMTSPSNRRNLPGLTAGYMPPNGDWGLPAKTTDAHGVLVWNPAIEWTGGGFVSNPHDLVLWAKDLYEGRAMKWPYLKDLFWSVPTTKGDPTSRYGAAVAINEKGPLGPNYGHSGWIPGYLSDMRYYADHHFAVAIQVNSIDYVSGAKPEQQHNRFVEFQSWVDQLAAVVAKSLHQ